MKNIYYNNSITFFLIAVTVVSTAVLGFSLFAAIEDTATESVQHFLRKETVETPCPSFIDITLYTMKDECTGVVWARHELPSIKLINDLTPDPGYSFVEAESYCTGLLDEDIVGEGDQPLFRVPTVEELMSLVQLDCKNVGAGLSCASGSPVATNEIPDPMDPNAPHPIAPRSPDYFALGTFWSSTDFNDPPQIFQGISAPPADYARSVNLLTGEVDQPLYTKETKLNVICVGNANPEVKEFTIDASNLIVTYRRPCSSDTDCGSMGSLTGVTCGANSLCQKSFNVAIPIFDSVCDPANQHMEGSVGAYQCEDNTGILCDPPPSPADHGIYSAAWFGNMMNGATMCELTACDSGWHLFPPKNNWCEGNDWDDAGYPQCTPPGGTLYDPNSTTKIWDFSIDDWSECFPTLCVTNADVTPAPGNVCTCDVGYHELQPDNICEDNDWMTAGYGACTFNVTGYTNYSALVSGTSKSWVSGAWSECFATSCTGTNTLRGTGTGQHCGCAGNSATGIVSEYHWDTGSSSCQSRKQTVSTVPSPPWVPFSSSTSRTCNNGAEPWREQAAGGCAWGSWAWDGPIDGAECSGSTCNPIPGGGPGGATCGDYDGDGINGNSCGFPEICTGGVDEDLDDDIDSADDDCVAVNFTVESASSSDLLRMRLYDSAGVNFRYELLQSSTVNIPELAVGTYTMRITWKSSDNLTAMQNDASPTYSITGDPAESTVTMGSLTGHHTGGSYTILFYAQMCYGSGDGDGDYSSGNYPCLAANCPDISVCSNSDYSWILQEFTLNKI